MGMQRPRAEWCFHAAYVAVFHCQSPCTAMECTRHPAQNLRWCKYASVNLWLLPASLQDKSRSLISADPFVSHVDRLLHCQVRRGPVRRVMRDPSLPGAAAGADGAVGVGSGAGKHAGSLAVAVGHRMGQPLAGSLSGSAGQRQRQPPPEQCSPHQRAGMARASDGHGPADLPVRRHPQDEGGNSLWARERPVDAALVGLTVFAAQLMATGCYNGTQASLCHHHGCMTDIDGNKEVASLDLMQPSGFAPHSHYVSVTFCYEGYTL